MADDTTTTAPDTVPSPTPTDPAATAPTSVPDDHDKPPRHVPVEELAGEREKRHKAESDLAALRKEVEDSKKSAEQKAADDLKAAQAEAAANAAKALRYEVAAERGIPLNLAHRLIGGTREEIEADADTLKGQLPTSDATSATPPRPAPDPAQGPRPQAQKTQEDLDYEALFGAST